MNLATVAKQSVSSTRTLQKGFVVAELAVSAWATISLPKPIFNRVLQAAVVTPRQKFGTIAIVVSFTKLAN